MTCYVSLIRDKRFQQIEVEIQHIMRNKRKKKFVTKCIFFGILIQKLYCIPRLRTTTEEYTAAENRECSRTFNI